ncbi:hypothetical protein [Cupriavidus metallidurans]|uniref:hypothetical protein n=1 Tax=Cupriavidus metallidurans TaxID=119219 RepID=UPI0039A21062
MSTIIDAHGHESLLAARTVQFCNCLDDEHGACCTHRMTRRNAGCSGISFRPACVYVIEGLLKADWSVEADTVHADT